MSTRQKDGIVLMIAAPFVGVAPLALTFAIIGYVMLTKPPGWQGIGDLAILGGMGLIVTVPVAVIMLLAGLVMLLLPLRQE